ncbi:hypothetical protein FGIG_01948 [Fasciola gigantica]|uniref:Uncharacterized protein n=1 Tax=Fasciola gigantica TaxID=46835 RepID=A0A504Z1C7_FASGI|nr:hypothetical protein FGIG_01948 [Fasciola gigantica]
MLHLPSADGGNSPEDTKPVRQCIRRILNRIDQVKLQLASFHLFIQVTGLKQDVYTLISLIRSETNQPTSCSGTRSDHRGQSSCSFSTPRTSRICYAPQETINQVLQLHVLPRKPIIYATFRDNSTDLIKANKYYHRTKSSNTSDNNGINPNDTIQLNTSPHSVRQSITLVTKSLCVLEHLLKLILIKYPHLKQSLESLKSLDDQKSVSWLIRTHQLRRLTSGIVDAVDRINNRRHVDRVLIHLRRRSTAKSLMYLIDQEKHKKSRWRL